jgi:hypothetical protein
MSTTQPRTRRASGYAASGAVNQHDGGLPVYTCTTCAREVVWATSRRTGRPYLVNVRRGYHDQRFYIGNDVHPRNCADLLAAQVAEIDSQQRARNVAGAMTDLMSAHQHGTLDTDTFLAALDTLEGIAS